MENNEIRTRRTREEWAAIVEAQERSGESATSFCRQRGINCGQFWYWRKISKTKSEVAEEPSVSRALSLTKPGAFIPVKLGESGSIRFRFPGGLVLESDRIPPAGWVVDLVAEWNSREVTQC